MKNLFLLTFVALGIYLANAEPMQPGDCKCRLEVSSRIIGGTELRNRIPWMVN